MSKKVFKTWTKEEVELLKNNYNEPYEYLEGLFPDRSSKSIKHKITNTKLPREYEFSRYSAEEDDILKNNLHLKVSEVKKLLHNRTVESILQRYRYLGLEWTKTWEYWSDEDVDIINKCDTIEEMSILLPNRTPEKIYSKAKKMNKYFNDWWTEEEHKILTDNYSNMHVSEFIHLLPNRNERSIYSRANKLGMKGLMGRYDVKNEEIMRLYYQDISASEISRKLGVTVNTVTNRIKAEGILFKAIVLSGEDAPNWKGGITPENVKIRASNEYKQWRISVFERDKYTCQCCGDSKGGNLHSHHIENFSDHKELRFDVENGITLCNECHNPSVFGSFHHIYGTSNNSKEQLGEYIENFKMDLVI